MKNLARIKFIASEKPTGLQVSSNIEQSVDFLKIFFTNELINQIITETNNYAAKKLEWRTLSSHSIWQTWHNDAKEEFWAFIAIIINMETMPLANIQEY